MNNIIGFLLLSLFFKINNVFAMFNVADCVLADFNSSVEITKLPFNLFKSSIMVSKSRCLLQVRKKSLFSYEWKIDLCREPVHIKYSGLSGDDFYLKEKESCPNESNYCANVAKVMDILEHESLIYAEGERETLLTDHGKFYCSFLLLKSYLNEGKVFSLTVPAAVNIFINTPLSDLVGVSGDIPASLNSSSNPNLNSQLNTDANKEATNKETTKEANIETKKDGVTDENAADKIENSKKIPGSSNPSESAPGIPGPPKKITF